MTSPADRRRRDDIALLREAAERWRAYWTRRKAAGDEVPASAWSAAEMLNGLERAVGRGSLDEQTRRNAVQWAKRIVADTGG